MLKTTHAFCVLLIDPYLMLEQDYVKRIVLNTAKILLLCWILQHIFADIILTALRDNISMKQSENVQSNQLIQIKAHVHQTDHFGILWAILVNHVLYRLLILTLYWENVENVTKIKNGTNKQDNANLLSKIVDKVTILINLPRNVLCKVMTLIHFVLLKDLSGTIKPIAVISVGMINLSTIKLKKHVVYVLINKASINLRSNASQNQLLHNAPQMNITTANLSNVKKEELLQCAHHQLHTGIQLISNVFNAQQINLRSMLKLCNANNAH